MQDAASSLPSGRALNEQVPQIAGPAQSTSAPSAEGSAWVRLMDSDWMNIVNAPDVLNSMHRDEAVANAVKLTEARLRELNVNRPESDDSALPLAPMAWMKRTNAGSDWDAYDFSANQHGEFTVPLFTSPCAAAAPLGYTHKDAGFHLKEPGGWARMQGTADTTFTVPVFAASEQCQAEGVLRELTALTGRDPNRNRTSAGRWTTVNVPTELWDRAQLVAASGVPLHVAGMLETAIEEALASLDAGMVAGAAETLRDALARIAIPGARECCNGECNWHGETDRHLGAIGPLCPECGEVTELRQVAQPTQAQDATTVSAGTARTDGARPSEQGEAS